MGLDHTAIRKAYPDAVTIDDGLGAFDKDGNKISLDQSKINTARTTLNTEAAAVKYKTDRTTNGSTTYASFGDQLDMLYKDIVAGTVTTSGTWATHIKAVKDANPKP
jgi:hypothetical protein|tara:strand:- start:534 stop:854 length:321 start_codon:yes stop_codon:yes gene_type:complete